jgi:hypothetical protein
MSFGKNTQESSQTFDPELKEALLSVFRKGKTVSNQPYQPYNYAAVSPISPFQQQGMQGAVDAARARLGNQQMMDATNAAAGVMRGSPERVKANMFDTSSAGMKPYLNQYNTAVVDQSIADIERARLIQQAQNQAQATAANAFGGDRSGIVRAETNRAALDQTARTAAQLRQQGYGQAAGLMQGDVGRMMQAQQLNQAAGLQGAGQKLQGAQTLADLGNTRRAMAFADAAAMQQVGQQQRMLAQQTLDDRYGRFATKVDYPIKMFDVLRGGAAIMPSPLTAQSSSSGPAGIHL